MVNLLIGTASDETAILSIYLSKTSDKAQLGALKRNIFLI